MPSHITHILLADDIYKRITPKNISYDYFITFSLGADLTKYSKVRKLSHKVYQKELILNMFKYLEANNLTTDQDLLGTIYGHISHMIADKTIHELIYKESRACPNKQLKNHLLLESHYDSYILKEKLGLIVNKFKLKNYLKANLNKVSKMLDYAYYQTYGYKHISLYYRLMLFLYRRFDLIYLINLKLLKHLSNYNTFIKDNYSCINNQEFMKLFNQCINETIQTFKNFTINLKSASN